jgi:hypothetical protein
LLLVVHVAGQEVRDFNVELVVFQLLRVAPRQKLLLLRFQLKQMLFLLYFQQLLHLLTFDRFRWRLLFRFVSVQKLLV